MSAPPQPTAAEGALRDAFRATAREIRPSTGTADIVRRRHQRRRRRQLVTVSLAAAAAAIAGILVVPRALVSADPAIIRPDQAPVSNALDTVYGVDVTWLPPGMRHQSRDFQDDPGEGQFEVSAQYAEDRVPRPRTDAAVGARSSPSHPSYRLAVARGMPTALDRLDHRSRFDTSWTTVRGQRALVIRSVLIDGTPTVSLDWNETTVSLSVGTVGGSLDEVRRVAAGLIVGPAPHGPADAAAAADAIRSVVRTAYTSPTPQAALGYVRGGEALLAAVEAEVRVRPHLLRGAWVTRVDPVVFLSSTEALATYNFSRLPQSGPLREQGSSTVELALTDRGWRLVAEPDCTVVDILVCPPG